MATNDIAGMQAAVSVLQSKWSVAILAELADGTHRFNELLRHIEQGGDARAATSHYRRAAEYDPGYAPPALALAARAADVGDQAAAETLLIDAAHAAMQRGGEHAAVPLQRGLALVAGQRRGARHATAHDRATVAGVRGAHRAVADVRHREAASGQRRGRPPVADGQLEEVVVGVEEGARVDELVGAV